MATAHKLEDLEAYQLAVELRDEVLRLTNNGPVMRDHRYRDQIRDAARSVARNLAEGFRRFKPRVFANFARTAAGSLGELQDEIDDGRKQSYFSREEADRLISLTRRTAGATTALIRYLDSCKGKAPSDSAADRPNNAQGTS